MLHKLAQRNIYTNVVNEQIYTDKICFMVY